MIPISIQWNALRLVYVRATMSKKEWQRKRERKQWTRRRVHKSHYISEKCFMSGWGEFREIVKSHWKWEWEKKSDHFRGYNKKKAAQIKINTKTQTVDQKIVLRLSVAQLKMNKHVNSGIVKSHIHTSKQQYTTMATVHTAQWNSLTQWSMCRNVKHAQVWQTHRRPSTDDKNAIDNGHHRLKNGKEHVNQPRSDEDSQWVRVRKREISEKNMKITVKLCIILSLTIYLSPNQN